jgi:hypothetical protein
MPHIFFSGNYLLRMYEIHAQYNWMFHLHMWFFHIISIYVYGLTPARNKSMHVFPVPARFLKHALRGTRFDNDESVILAVRRWLREQETSWYRESMHALVLRWRKAIDIDGDYVCVCVCVCVWGGEEKTCVKETSSYTVREFHTFWINSFWGEKKWGGGGITFWAALVENCSVAAKQEVLNLYLQ